GVDELVLGHRELRLGLLFQVIVAILAQPRNLGAEKEVFDLNFTLRFFVAALNHHAWTAALVSVFHLRAEFAVAQIKLGTNLLSRRVFRVAQLGDHALIISDRYVRKDRHDHWPRLRLALDLAKMLQRRHQPRHADRNARGRHRFAAKARNEFVVAAAASDRPEAHRFSALAFDRKGQLNLVHRASVVFETANDRGLDADTIVVIPRK